MDVLVKYIARYSPPVVVTIVVLFIGGYFIKYGIEKTLEVEFQKRDRQLELAMKRQSNFQEKMMWQKYLVLTSQNEVMHQLRAEINGYLIRKDVEPTFMKDGDMYRLTEVYEQLNINRFLIGEDMYKLMRQQGRLLIQLSKLKPKEDEKYKYILNELMRVDKLYIESMQRIFNISDSGISFKPKVN